MFATTAVRQLRPMASAAPAFRAAAFRPQVKGIPSQVGLGMARRWNTQEQKGGKSKLYQQLTRQIFRFGMRDIPVELYPMAFVVAAAVVGATFAVGRHFYLDGLRLSPAGKKSDE